uniref:Uncharacterized protein n=1 Tax=Caenorhabditis japonica TaxID=281687 RepID=A0A8R1EH65_CAEJA
MNFCSLSPILIDSVSAAFFIFDRMIVKSQSYLTIVHTPFPCLFLEAMAVLKPLGVYSACAGRSSFLGGNVRQFRRTQKDSMKNPSKL